MTGKVREFCYRRPVGTLKYKLQRTAGCRTLLRLVYCIH